MSNACSCEVAEHGGSKASNTYDRHVSVTKSLLAGYPEGGEFQLSVIPVIVDRR